MPSRHMAYAPALVLHRARCEALSAESHLGRGRRRMDTAASSKGIGASLPRKEDWRHLRGRGEFVSDIRMPGIRDVAFVRSPHANARIRGISVASEARG